VRVIEVSMSLRTEEHEGNMKTEIRVFLSTGACSKMLNIIKNKLRTRHSGACP
jgi:hypothetical protein